MTYETIIVETRGKVGLITLNRPEALNALNSQVLAELGVLGFAPDPKKARAWYQRAAELGSSEAERRLERLAQAGN